MTLARRMANHQFRQPNKEAEWSGLCNNVFDQYLTGDDVFGLGPDPRGRSSSDNSANLFDFSVSSGQSNHTSGTSPDSAWAEQVAVAAAAMTAPSSASLSMLAMSDEAALQPKARESYGYWQKTLETLEHNAAEAEEHQRRLRASRSHPDFLSLGGNPSPAYVPCPVPDPSFSVQRSRPREPANGKKRSTSQVRSVSRGRPQRIAKSGSHPALNVQSANNTCTPIRKASQSPSKMMNPSRYRAGTGLREVWTDRTLSGSPAKLAFTKVPTQSLPESPPPSAQVAQNNFAAFGPAAIHQSTEALLAAYDSQLSPLTTTFQAAKIHTPDESPFFSSPSHNASYFEQNAAASAYMPSQGMVPVYPSRTTSLAANRIGSFDFGFNNGASQESWTESAYEQTSMNQHMTQDVLSGVEHGNVQLVDHTGVPTGLGISCDAIAYCPATSSDYASIPAQAYEQMQHLHPASRACYPPMLKAEQPSTPRKQALEHIPSPPMTEPRSRRPSGGSKHRRASKHRRTKSTTSVPRQMQSLDAGGFVNFTPSDSGKILSGVAPSGSSKTKARREKEAADKRRRLSQAALTAVIAAGGNPQHLHEAGLSLDLEL